MRSTYAILVAVCCFLAFGNVYSQIDETFCSTTSIIPDDGLNFPLPYRNESERYRVITEKAVNKYGEEIIEYYDGLRNRGYASYRAANREIKFFLFDEVDEFLVITDKNCRVVPTDLDVPGLPFRIIKVNGKNHIATPLTLLSSNPNLTHVYLGSNNRFVRGIPVREWQTCAYSENTEATLKITISYSNPDKWQSQAGVGYSSVPVQIRVQAKYTNGTQDNELFSLTQFRPNYHFRDEDFTLPEGVYCPNRKTKMPLPPIPPSFSFISHFIIENEKFQNDERGSFSIYRLEFDFEKKLARNDFRSQERDLITIIADFNTNLVYEINRSEQTCSVGLGGSGFAFDIFAIDQNPPLEYMGTRWVRGIHTNVWSAPRNLSSVEYIVEWHFMTKNWTSVESTLNPSREEPIQIIATAIDNPTAINKPDLFKFTFEIADFDSKRIDLYDFDVSLCEDVEKKHIAFSMTPPQVTTFFQAELNQQHVRELLLLAIQKSAGVSLIRLSQLHLTFDEGTIYATFTLHDRSLIGTSQDSIGLVDAFNKVANDIRKSQLSVTFTVKDQTFTLKSDKDSLIELKSRNNLRYVYNEKRGKTTGNSAGLVIFLIILFVVIGTLIGLVVGVFIFVRKTVNLPGPLSFLNPNYD